MLLLLLTKVFLTLGGYITPEQIHLSWTGTENEMRVTWVTFLPIENFIYYRGILCLNSSDWYYSSVSSQPYNVGYYFSRIEYIHSVIIPVSTACIYEYYVGSWLGWSKTYTFVGRTPSLHDMEPTKMILVADFGGGSQGQNTRNLLVEELDSTHYDAVLHAGDIAYNLEDLAGMVGDNWLNMVQPIAASVPYMTLPGNHESFDHYSQYRNRFLMPPNEAGSVYGYYSFTIGRAHYILLNTDIFFSRFYEQEVALEIKWLRQDLQKANEDREEVPWIVVLTHRNLYCSVDWNIENDEKAKDCVMDTMKLRGAIEDILYEAGVDLFMQAHVHNYERNTPVYRNQTVKSEEDTEFMHFNPRAPVYITNGNSGNVEGHNDEASSTPQLWSVYTTEMFGYGRLTVHNKTHLYYEQFSTNYQQIIDHLWIIKDKPRYN